MEVCFLLLHPTDPANLLLSTAVIRWLNNQVEGAEVFSIAPAASSWLLEAQKPDRLLTYDRDPLILRPVIGELLPDYLVDLEGKGFYKRLKRKLKILDFPVEKLSLFDVADDHAGPFFAVPGPNPAWFPESFGKGYLALSLEGLAGLRDQAVEQLVRLATLIEYPMVLTGSAQERPLADEIARKAGCTVYPACGDFTPLQAASIIRGSGGLVALEPLWKMIGETIGKPVVYIDGSQASSLGDDPAELIGQVRQWIKN
ncbi:MAG: hypothetical protein R6V75_01835 [Bacteroidales bacterium]